MIDMLEGLWCTFSAEVGFATLAELALATFYNKGYQSSLALKTEQCN